MLNCNLLFIKSLYVLYNKTQRYGLANIMAIILANLIRIFLMYSPKRDGKPVLVKKYF